MTIQEIFPSRPVHRVSEILPDGLLIGEQYIILNTLSSHPFGGVYLCQLLHFPEEKAVVKLLDLDLLEGDDVGEVMALLFSNELIALQRISHPHVLGATEFIRDKQFAGYAMEYVTNGDLRTVLQKQDLPISTIVQILSQICAGLQAIHQADVIHRDLKPENILLTDDGDVKISDFGVAELVGEPVPNIPEHVTGTVDYLSPEYILHGELDHRLDIYSVGIMAYEMLTGRIPFELENQNKSLSLRASIDPFPPETYNPICPQRLSEITLKAVSRRPEGRYQSAEELLVDLEELL